MEEFKGTNGEWKYKIHNSRIIFSKPNMDLWFKDEESDNDFKEKPSEVLANAKLIAAAPEMLEALKDFVKAVENEDIIIYDNLDHDGFASTPSRIYQKSKKVIEKALGKNF